MCVNFVPYLVSGQTEGLNKEAINKGNTVNAVGALSIRRVIVTGLEVNINLEREMV